MASVNSLNSSGSSEIFDVLLVSAFGRGNWMARHLREQGWQVALVDVTGLMGTWEPADYDGPFGLFETERLSPTQKTEWLSGGLSALITGFSFLLPEGPVEGHSFALGSVSEFSRAYLRELNESRKPRASQIIGRQKFSETWLPHLSHQVASALYEENHKAAGVAHGIPFFAPYHLRELKTDSHEKSLKALETSGIQVFKASELSHLIFENHALGSRFKSIKVNGRELSAQAAAWLLSSEETEVVSRELRLKIYPKGRADSQWCWLRYQVELKKNSLSEVLPRVFSLVFDLYQPWTHANLLHLRKQSGPQLASGPSELNTLRWNVWLRLPTRFRFDKAYLEKMKESLQTNLQTRFPLNETNVFALPLEARSSYEKLKSPRLPVFSQKELAHFKTYQAKNFFVSGVEKWHGLDALSFLEGQREIVSRLENLKRIWDERALKLKEKMERRAK